MMYFMVHEPTILIIPAFGRGVVGVSEIAASPEDPCGPLSSVQSYLATGGRVQFGEASEIAGLQYTNAHEWVKRFMLLLLVLFTLSSEVFLHFHPISFSYLLPEYSSP